MASDDRPKLPRATLRDDKLYVEGETEPYFQDREHSIGLRVSKLTIRRGYEPEEFTDKRSSKVLTESLRGVAELEGGDQLAVVGLETDQTTPIEFHLGPISDTETKYHWLINIGFRARDGEFDWKETFWISGHCARQHLDDLLAAVRRGYIDNIRVEMDTTMWTRDPASPFGGPTRRTWYLTPPPDGGESTEPGLGHGNISSLTWEEKFAPHSADQAKDHATPKPQLVELPARLYSLLTALVAIVAALLVLTYLLTVKAVQF